jgi:hypothetical protein
VPLATASAFLLFSLETCVRGNVPGFFTLQRQGAPERNCAMCDYSLEHVASRPAVTADRLITTNFPTTLTRGFAGVSDPLTAVCVRPGTELAFDRPPRYRRAWTLWSKTAPGTLARFRQINPTNPHTHHDALEFSDGTLVRLAALDSGQTATVLQLPKGEKAAPNEATTQPERPVTV